MKVNLLICVALLLSLQTILFPVAYGKGGGGGGGGHSSGGGGGGGGGGAGGAGANGDSAHSEGSSYTSSGSSGVKYARGAVVLVWVLTANGMQQIRSDQCVVPDCITEDELNCGDEALCEVLAD